MSKIFDRAGELRPILRAAFLLSSAGVLSGLLGYVYQIMMSRLMTLKDFALLSIIMSYIFFLYVILRGKKTRLDARSSYLVLYWSVPW